MELKRLYVIVNSNEEAFNTVKKLISIGYNGNKDSWIDENGELIVKEYKIQIKYIIAYGTKDTEKDLHDEKTIYYSTVKLGENSDGYHLIEYKDLNEQLNAKKIKRIKLNFKK